MYEIYCVVFLRRCHVWIPQIACIPPRKGPTIMGLPYVPSRYRLMRKPTTPRSTEATKLHTIQECGPVDIVEGEASGISSTMSVGFCIIPGSGAGIPIPRDISCRFEHGSVTSTRDMPHAPSICHELYPRRRPQFETHGQAACMKTEGEVIINCSPPV